MEADKGKCREKLFLVPDLDIEITLTAEHWAAPFTRKIRSSCSARINYGTMWALSCMRRAYNKNVNMLMFTMIWHHANRLCVGERRHNSTTFHSHICRIFRHKLHSTTYQQSKKGTWTASNPQYFTKVTVSVLISHQERGVNSIIHDFDLFSHTVSSIVVFEMTFNHKIFNCFSHNLVINPFNNCTEWQCCFCHASYREPVWSLHLMFLLAHFWTPMLFLSLFVGILENQGSQNANRWQWINTVTCVSLAGNSRYMKPLLTGEEQLHADNTLQHVIALYWGKKKNNKKSPPSLAAWIVLLGDGEHWRLRSKRKRAETVGAVMMSLSDP